MNTLDLLGQREPKYHVILNTDDTVLARFLLKIEFAAKMRAVIADASQVKGDDALLDLTADALEVAGVYMQLDGLLRRADEQLLENGGDVVLVPMTKQEFKLLSYTVDLPITKDIVPAGTVGKDKESLDRIVSLVAKSQPHLKAAFETATKDFTNRQNNANVVTDDGDKDFDFGKFGGGGMLQ